MKRSILLLSLFLFAGGMLFAQQTSNIPTVISYQGLLTSSDGNPMPDGEYPITVTLYGDEKGASLIWQSTCMAMVQGGIFNIYLGSGTAPLPAPSQMDRPLWVGTRIGDNDEMRPLTRLGATPYAINVQDNAITAGKIANGSITAEKVDMEYLAGVNINGKKITGNGTVLNIRGGKDVDIQYDETTQSLVIGSSADAIADSKSDRERSLQGTANDAWTMRGNGITVPGGSAVAPAAGDYIGTNNNIPFNLHVDNTRIMSYQRKAPGATPSIIGGDQSNSVTNASAIGHVIAGGGGGGAPNTIDGDWYDVIGGGYRNRILHSGSRYSVIGGGDSNEIGTSTRPVWHGTIAGGQKNRVGTSYSVVGGGQVNIITEGEYSMIGGGNNNLIEGGTSMIGGGSTNRIIGTSGTVGGGVNHNIFNALSTHGFIGGGQNNEIGTATVAATHGTIAGGQGHRVTANHGTVGGGQANSVNGRHSVIGGGSLNQIFGWINTIGGGGGNVILHLNSSYGTIGGGESNTIGMVDGYVSHATIAGGQLNRVINTYGTIGGGRTNHVNGAYATIGGGTTNRIQALAGVIGGGQGNYIEGNSSVVGGGGGNRIYASLGAIGGGHINDILANGTAATIPGGEFLVAQSYGQTVVGVRNIPKGTTVPGDVPSNEPIFIIGNGIQEVNSNAFEVSYNGHSTVFHNTSGISSVILGSTYVDNVIYAWGDVDANGAAISSFGVKNITQLGPGWYQVKMDIVDTDGSTVMLDANNSVTAAIRIRKQPGKTWDGRCATITVSEVANNVFDVYIADPTCGPVDESFTFKVTGRP